MCYLLWNKNSSNSVYYFHMDAHYCILQKATLNQGEVGNVTKDAWLTNGSAEIWGLLYPPVLGSNLLRGASAAAKLPEMVSPH